jgi:hypothetical protein
MLRTVRSILDITASDYHITIKQESSSDAVLSADGPPSKFKIGEDLLEFRIRGVSFVPACSLVSERSSGVSALTLERLEDELV